MKYLTSQSGFSLVETLVAITILLLVIIGPLSISSSTARSTAFASEQVTAFFLAQEGLELAQKGRDELVLERLSSNGAADPWSKFQKDSGRLENAPFRFCYANGCGLSIDNAGRVTIKRLGSGANSGSNLYLSTSPATTRARYLYDTSGSPTLDPTLTLTLYSRSIKFDRVSANEVSVVSTVTWQSGFSREVQKVEVQTSLFDVYGTQ